MIQAGQLPRKALSTGRWVVPAMAANGLLLGAAIGAESRIGLVAVGASAAALLFALPVPVLAAMSLAGAMLFRLVAPAAVGPLALLPDILVLVLCGRVLADRMLGRGGVLPVGMRRMTWPLAAFLALTLASTIVSGDRLLVWGQSMRQFLRFPLWALAITSAEMSAADAKRLVRIVLMVSLVQFPIALHQFRNPMGGVVVQGVHFFKGDNVSGTFGYGGSSTAMIFLVLASVVWLRLVFERVVPAALLWLLAPFLVLPMAMGSAASYVLFLPLAILGMTVQRLVSRRFALTGSGLVAGGVLLVISVWAAGHLALAPGFAGSSQPNGTALLSESYLAKYLSESQGSNESGSRLGFLRFAIGSDLRSGPTGVAFGHGPSLSILDPNGPTRLEGELGSHSELATRSVQSLQRLLIGYGFFVPGLFLLIVLTPLFGMRRAATSDPTLRAVLSALPVVALVFVVAGVYNAPWSDPGVSAAFWSLVAAGCLGATARGGQERAPGEGDLEAFPAVPAWDSDR